MNDTLVEHVKYVTRDEMEAYINERLSDDAFQKHIAAVVLDGLRPYADILQLQVAGAIAKQLIENN